MVARSRKRHYKLEELYAACLSPGKVRVTGRAKRQAAECFNLEDEATILGFISLGDLQGLVHQNTDELDNGPDAGVTFDAYLFKIGPDSVYFAFYQRPSTGVWIIKSFHPPDHGPDAPSLSYKPFGQLLGSVKR
jgi:hypothetical protein